MNITKEELWQLREARMNLDMERCSFHAPDQFQFEGGWPERDDAFTVEVRNSTKLWLETWIFPAIDRILDKKEKE